MYHILDKMPDPNQVSAGGKSTFRLPKGVRYKTLLLVVKSTKAANNKIADGIIDRINLKINGKRQQEIIPAIYEAEMKIRGFLYRAASTAALSSPFVGNGQAANAGGGATFIVHLSEPWRSPRGQEATAWGTGNIVDFSVEVEVNSLTTVPQLDLYAYFDEPLIDGAPIGLGSITQRRITDISISSTGEKQFQNFPVGDLYDSIFFKPNAIGDISAFRLEVNGEVAFRDGDVDGQISLSSELSKIWGMKSSPTSADVEALGLYPVMLSTSGKISDMLPTVNPVTRVPVSRFIAYLTMDAANDVTAYYNTYGLPNI